MTGVGNPLDDALLMLVENNLLGRHWSITSLTPTPCPMLMARSRWLDGSWRPPRTTHVDPLTPERRSRHPQQPELLARVTGARCRPHAGRATRARPNRIGPLPDRPAVLRHAPARRRRRSTPSLDQPGSSRRGRAPPLRRASAAHRAARAHLRRVTALCGTIATWPTPRTISRRAHAAAGAVVHVGPPHPRTDGAGVRFLLRMLSSRRSPSASAGPTMRFAFSAGRRHWLAAGRRRRGTRHNSGSGGRSHLSDRRRCPT